MTTEMIARLMNKDNMPFSLKFRNGYGHCSVGKIANNNTQTVEYPRLGKRLVTI